MYGNLSWQDVINKFGDIVINPGLPRLGDLALVSNAPLYSHAALAAGTLGVIAEQEVAIFDTKVGETGQGFTVANSRSMTNLKWSGGQPTDNQMFIGLAAGFKCTAGANVSAFGLKRDILGENDLNALLQNLSWLVEDPNGRTTVMGDLLHWGLPSTYRGFSPLRVAADATIAHHPRHVCNGGKLRELRQPLIFRPNTSTRIKIRYGTGVPEYLGPQLVSGTQLPVIIEGVMAGFLVTRPI